MLSIKKITSFLLIILIVGYSGGINIAKHLCDGEVVSKALNHEVKVCKKSSCDNPLSKNHGVSELPCCKTVFNFQQSDSFEKSVNQITFLEIPAMVQYVPYEEPVEKEVALDNYASPNLYSPPIFIAIEQYLI